MSDDNKPEEITDADTAKMILGVVFGVSALAVPEMSDAGMRGGFLMYILQALFILLFVALAGPWMKKKNWF